MAKSVAKLYPNCNVYSLANILETAGATFTSHNDSYDIAWKSLMTAEFCREIHTPRPDSAMHVTARLLSEFTWNECCNITLMKQPLKQNYPHCLFYFLPNYEQSPFKITGFLIMTM